MLSPANSVSSCHSWQVQWSVGNEEKELTVPLSSPQSREEVSMLLLPVPCGPARVRERRGGEEEEEEGQLERWGEGGV